MKKSKINILVDCHFLDYDFIHGASVYVRQLYSEMIKKEDGLFQYHFAAYDTKKLKTYFTDQQNITFVKYKFKNGLYRLLVDIPLLIKKFRIDILHVQYISPFRKSCLEIVTIHDVLFKDFPRFFPLKYKWISNYLFKRSAIRADILLTVSNYSKKSISKHYKIDENRISITPNAPSIYFNLQVSNKVKDRYNIERYILYVSRIEPRKNHVLLLRAFTELKLWEKNFSLMFVGKTTQMPQEYIAYLKTLSDNIKSHVIYKSQVSDTELVALYKEADLFIYPSLAEGFGIPPIEAAFCGTPCLCSNATAMEDFTFFEDRLFNPSDLNELKEKISKILNENDLEKNSKIQKYVTDNFQWRLSAHRLNSLINECIKSFNQL